MDKKFTPNKTDYLVAALKAGTGIIPGAGPILQELISNVIPNQRVDRIADYILVLEHKIEKIPSETIELILHKEDFISLIEEGFVQASRSTSRERENI